MYGGYGKPDPYSEYMSRGRHAPPKEGMSTDQMINAGSLGLNALGTAVGGYGAYKQYQAAEEAQDEEKRRYEEQRRRQAEQDAIAEEQRKMGNVMGYGGYAQAMDDRRRREYGGFASRVGL
jgi:hypothetical protein